MIAYLCLLFCIVCTPCFSGAISALAGRISTLTQALRLLYMEHLIYAAPSQLYVVQVSDLYIVWERAIPSLC